MKERSANAKKKKLIKTSAVASLNLQIGGKKNLVTNSAFIDSVKIKKTLLILVLLTVISVVFLFNRKAEVPVVENKPTPAIGLVQNSGLPEFFPADFPLYENAELIESWQNESGEGKGLSVLFETDDEVMPVSLFYKSELANKGWEVEVYNEDMESFLVSFQKNNYSGPLGIIKSDSGTTLISVTIGIK